MSDAATKTALPKINLEIRFIFYLIPALLLRITDVLFTLLYLHPSVNAPLL